MLVSEQNINQIDQSPIISKRQKLIPFQQLQTPPASDDVKLPSQESIKNANRYTPITPRHLESNNGEQKSIVTTHRHQLPCTFGKADHNNIPSFRYMQLLDDEITGLISRTIFLLYPSDMLLKMYNIFRYCYKLFILIYIPIQQSFQMPNITIWLIIIKIIDVLIMSSIDQFKQHSINSRLEYLKDYLFQDFIGIIVLIFLDMQDDNWIIIFVFMIINLMELEQTFRSIKLEYSIVGHNSQIYTDTIHLLVIVNGLICFWNEQITNQIDQKDDMNERYIIAFQCIIRVITLNSPFNPITNRDRIVDSTCSLIGVYILAKLFILINLSSHKMNENFDQIVQYFKEQPIKICTNIKWQTLSEVSKHNYKSTTPFSKKILQQIDTWKTTQILLNYFKQYNPISIKKVAQYAQTIKYHQNQIILTQGQVDDGAIYFLLQGTIEFITITGEILQSVNQPLSVFGELAFYTQMTRSLSVRVQEDSVLLKLKSDDFIKNLRQEDKERYFQRRDLILYKDEYPFTCLCCQQTNHSIIKCQKLQYKPHLTQILEQNVQIHNQIQERQQYVRKKHNRSMKAHFLQNEISIHELISLYKNNNISNGVSFNNNSVVLEESQNNYPILFSMKSQFSQIGEDDGDDDEVNEMGEQVSDDDLIQNRCADIFFRDSSKQYSKINMLAESSRQIQKTKSINSFAALGSGKHSVTANNFMEFGCKDFDKMCVFTIFHPLDNYNRVIGYKF